MSLDLASETLHNLKFDSFYLRADFQLKSSLESQKKVFVVITVALLCPITTTVQYTILYVKQFQI